MGNYARVVEVFRGHGYVNKVGLLASEAGFYWFNFWWARGSYLAAVPKPLRHTRAGAEVERHYYMGWVGYQNCTMVPAKTYPWNVTEVWPTASECHFRTTPYDCWDTWTGGMAASTSHTDAMAVHRLLLAGDAVEAMVGSVALTGTKVPS